MPENNKKILKFPKDFLWGVSTSAHQIEGGAANDWSCWERSEFRIKNLELRNENPNNYICGLACDSYNRYEEDIKLVKDLNCGAYRLGIEWARIEPEEGKWDRKEIEHYRKVLMNLKANNLKVVLTLWHWTNPIWLADKGGWANKEAVKYFSRYVEFIVNQLGDLVDYWLTLNEPMVYIANGHITGKFPPNKKSIFIARKVFNNLIRAHKTGYGVIHNKYTKAEVSITQLMNYFEPARKWCLVEAGLAKLASWIWNERFLNKIKNELDYIGLDYYFHDRIVWYPPFKKNENKKITDMGWEIYPKGIYYVLKSLAKFKKPIIVMENGLADADDKERVNFIREHLKYVYKAIGGGVSVRGYFYWSLLDNFEWAAGFDPKFGLYEVDRKTFKRTARPSAKMYAEICKNNMIKISNF
ncbi:MAG: glycoside hydrolase family 1 protein [Patescibacteria group bacterium]|nr:glycoside hydrolase family 1 protein [Patescibacteria group bacterium]